MDQLQPNPQGDALIEPVSPIEQPLEVTNQAGETVMVTPFDLAMAVARELSEAPAESVADRTERFKITHRLTAAVAPLDSTLREQLPDWVKDVVESHRRKLTNARRASRISLR